MVDLFSHPVLLLQQPFTNFSAIIGTLSIDDERDDDDELRREKTGSRTSFTAGKFTS